MTIFIKGNQRLFQAILRQDLSSFIEKTFKSLNPGTKFHRNWHIDLLSSYLSEAIDGNIKRLIINIPPRSLKSIITSVAFPAFIIGKDPTKKIISASFARSLSIKHALDTRFVMESSWYRQLFPVTKLSKKQNQKSKFMTNHGGFRMAVSVGSMVTGEGADILIIDDPHNPSHIYSNKRRQQVLNWYDETLSTRLNDKKEGMIILVMQRLHEDDLSAHLSKDYGFNILQIPAIASEEREYIVRGQKYIQKTGEIFDTKRFSRKILDNIQKEMGYRSYLAQYIQKPVEASNMLKFSDLSFYEHLKLEFEYFALSIDTAIHQKEESDYSVCSIWGVKQDYYYLIQLYRAKPSYSQLKSKIISYVRKYKPRYILIEDHGSGSILIQDMKYLGIENIISIRPKFDKITRFTNILGMIESARVKFPKRADLIGELTTFPHSKHDDIIDSISQFLGYIKDISRQNARIREI